VDEGYRFDEERLKNAVTSRTKLIFVCNPHNPTGRVMTREELESIADIAVDHNLTVMSDELWEDIIFDGRRHISLASLNSDVADRTVTSFGFSKTFGVAGLQVGYSVATNKQLMRKLKSVGFRDTGDPDEPALRGTGSLALAAAKAMLSRSVDYYVKELVAYLQEVRELAYERLAAIDGIQLNPLEGTFLTFPDMSGFEMTSERMTEYLLKEARVAVESGSEFGSSGEGHIRVNIGTSMEILTEALNRIERALKEIRQR